MFDEAVGCCLLVAIRSGPANEKAPEARIMKTQKSRVPPWESPLLHRPLCFFSPFLGHSPAGYNFLAFISILFSFCINDRQAKRGRGRAM